ncbi:hypothetical protein K438DRAFT_1780178 [Mycena galopus ATCC 62051]|nr:hypothetical protein K438DRAFT_1780178 [Mycena galopus ATCC 62051]
MPQPYRLDQWWCVSLLLHLLGSRGEVVLEGGEDYCSRISGVEPVTLRVPETSSQSSLGVLPSTSALLSKLLAESCTALHLLVYVRQSPCLLSRTVKLRKSVAVRQALAFHYALDAYPSAFLHSSSCHKLGAESLDNSGPSSAFLVALVPIFTQYKTITSLALLPASLCRAAHSLRTQDICAIRDRQHAAVSRYLISALRHVDHTPAPNASASAMCDASRPACTKSDPVTLARRALRTGAGTNVFASLVAWLWLARLSRGEWFRGFRYINEKTVVL